MNKYKWYIYKYYYILKYSLLSLFFYIFKIIYIIFVGVIVNIIRDIKDIYNPYNHILIKVLTAKRKE